MSPKPFAVLLLIGACSWYVAGRVADAESSPKANVNAPEIAGYTKWKVVNEKPHFVPLSLATDCSAPSMPSKGAVPSPGEWMAHHPSTLGKYIRVFVNDKGKAAMFAKKPQFPVGSVIVKEKLPDEKSRTPELLTVMIKREAGYDGAKGDWEYLVADGKGQKASSRGKLENCQGCHLARPATDYVFRDYLFAEGDFEAKNTPSKN